MERRLRIQPRELLEPARSTSGSSEATVRGASVAMVIWSLQVSPWRRPGRARRRGRRRSPGAGQECTFGVPVDRSQLGAPAEGALRFDDERHRIGGRDQVVAREPVFDPGSPVELAAGARVPRALEELARGGVLDPGDQEASCGRRLGRGAEGDQGPVAEPQVVDGSSRLGASPIERVEFLEQVPGEGGELVVGTLEERRQATGSMIPRCHTGSACCIPSHQGEAVTAGVSMSAAVNGAPEASIASSSLAMSRFHRSTNTPRLAVATVDTSAERSAMRFSVLRWAGDGILRRAGLARRRGRPQEDRS